MGTIFLSISSEKHTQRSTGIKPTWTSLALVGFGKNACWLVFNGACFMESFA